jgi:hypothetical protein
MLHYQIIEGFCHETTEDAVLAANKGRRLWQNVYTRLIEPSPYAYWNHEGIPDDACITVWGPFNPHEAAIALGYPTRVRCGCYGACPGVAASIATPDYVEASREFAVSTYRETEWGGYGD